MDELIKRLSLYNIVNYFVPGSLFSFLIYKFFSTDFLAVENTFVSIVMLYVTGLTINVIGSLTLSRFLRLLSKDYIVPYNDFLKAEKLDPKISLLSAENNSNRTIMTVFLLLILLKLSSIALYVGYQDGDATFLCGCAGFFLVFLGAFLKRTKFIYSRICFALDSSISELP